MGAAYARIPARFRKRMKNIALLVDPEPSPQQLARGRVPRGTTLLGLYEGRPLTARSVFDSFPMPDRITIFQGPHERLARDPNTWPGWWRTPFGTRWRTTLAWMKPAYARPSGGEGSECGATHKLK